MTDKHFLPRCKAVPTDKGYRPSFVRFEGERERLVPYAGGPRYFPTREAAEDAAADYLRPQLNPPVVGMQISIEAEMTEYDLWKQEKAQQAEAERLRIFGGAIFSKGRAVVVERRRSRI